MSEHPPQTRLAGRLRQRLVTSLGVQVMLLDAVRNTLSHAVTVLSDEPNPETLPQSWEGAEPSTPTPALATPALATPTPATPTPATPVSASETVAPAVASAPLLAPPYTAEAVRAVIQALRDTVSALDDVKDYDLIKDIDEDMYQLWKELERKMQRHRQSEARFQLKDMFRI